MSVQLLEQMIKIKDGKLTLSSNTLPNKALQTFLDIFYGQQQLVIEEADAITSGNKITVNGKASIFDVAATVTAIFEKTTMNEPSINLQFHSLPTLISFQNILNLSIPAADFIPDLLVEDITFRSDEQQNLNVNARIANNPPWNLQIGLAPIIVHDLSFQMTNLLDRTFEGTIKGKIDIAQGSSSDFIYKIPGPFEITFDVLDVELSELIDKVGGIHIPWPEGFSITLPPSKVFVKFINDSLSLHVTTKIEGIGLFLLSLFKQDEWTLSVLVDLDATRLSSVPGLQVLAPLDSFADLEGLVLYNVSREIDLELLGTILRDIESSFEIPEQHQILEKGMSVLTGPSIIRAPMFRLLTDFLKLEPDESGFTISVSLPDPMANTTIFLPFRMEILEGTVMDGRVGGLLRGGAIQAYLAASVHTEIQKQPVQIDVEGTVLPNGFLISGVYLGTIHFDPLPIQLSNLALLIGLSAQGIPSFGFAGTIDVQGWDSSIALFINSAQPTQCMIAGSVSSLTLNDIVHLIMGQPLPDALGQVLGSIGLKGINTFTLPVTLSEALTNREYRAISDAFVQHGGVQLPQDGDKQFLVETKERSEWAITDMDTMIHYRLFAKNENIEVELQPQLYCVPQETHIGSLKYPQGFHIAAAIDHLFMKMQIKIDASPSQGISGKTVIEPIILHDRDFFSITGEGAQGPLFSFSTYSRPEESDVILRDPHILIIGNVRVLGLDVLKTKILLQSDGLSFSVVSEPFIQQSEWSIRIDGSSNINGEGKLVVGISETLDAGPLGRTDVNVQVNASIRITYQDQIATASCEGGFDFFGIQCTIPSFELSISGRTIPELVNTIWSQMSEILIRLLHNPDHWLKMLRDGIIEGVEQIPEQLGKLLAEVHQISADEIAAKTKEILTYGSESVTRALKGANVDPNNMLPVLHGLGFSTGDIQSALGSVFPSNHIDTSCCHVDIPAGPHVDIQSHVDIPEIRTNTTVHTDIARTHTDTGSGRFHVDTTVTPHIDTKVHTDVLVTPHGDTQSHVDHVTPPHSDSDIHVDTGNH
ncbi:hypothetical protein [Paenibacillus harenae]|uniref:hypothetical protein n=1 Tax=Paenibacillus harenae TaxID=306543 RepID=UPI000428DD7B|nr:hypothetical protein [Paenibacillus harenae]